MASVGHGSSAESAAIEASGLRKRYEGRTVVEVR